MKTAVSALALLTACSPVLLPPPAQPSAQLPPIAQPPVTPRGEQRVVIDVVDGHARVVEPPNPASGNYMIDNEGFELPLKTTIDRTVCTTPCAVDMTRGVHDLELRSVSDPMRAAAVAVKVGPDPLGVRVALGHVHTPRRLRTGGLIVGVLGAALLGSAAVMGVYDTNLAPPGQPSSADTDFAIGASAVGIGALATGIVMMVLGRGELQPGSATVWPLQ